MTKRGGCVLQVFAKAPIAGEVKTRLCPPLSPHQAAALHRELLWHTLETASRAALGPIELWCMADIHDPFFNQCRAYFHLELKPQVSGDLGIKMRAALEAGLTYADRAILIGGDCPSITPTYLQSAATALAADNDVVLGPAEDGGYGLVGVAGDVAEIFTDIPWGTALVMNATLGRLREHDLRWHGLAPIWDVDRPDDLARLARDPQLNHLMKGFTLDRAVT